MSEDDVSHLACPQWTERDYGRLQELRARVNAFATVAEVIDRRVDNASFADWDDSAAVASEADSGVSGATARVTANIPAACGGPYSDSILARSGVSARSPMGLAEYAAAAVAADDANGASAGGPTEPQIDGGLLCGLDSTVVVSAPAFAAAASSRGHGGARALNEADQAELVSLEGRYSAFMKLERERRAAVPTPADGAGAEPAMDVGAFLQRAGKASWFWGSLVATASAAVASSAGVITTLHHWDIVLPAKKDDVTPDGKLILGALPVVTGLDHITKLKNQCAAAHRELGLIVSCMHEDEMHGFGLSAFATHTRWYQAFGITPPSGGAAIGSPVAATPVADATSPFPAAVAAAGPKHGGGTPTATPTTAASKSASTTTNFRCMLFQIDDCSATGATEEQMVSTIHAIHDTLISGRSVYVHCKAGKGRSWMVVACYLLTHWVEAQRGDARENLQVVVEHIRSKRPQVSPSGSQLQFAERYARFVLQDLQTREQMRLERAGAGGRVPSAFSNGVVMSEPRPVATATPV